MTIKWSRDFNIRTKGSLLTIYKKGTMQLNRAAVRAMAKDEYLRFIEVGYDAKRNSIALRPVKERSLSSFTVSSGTFSGVTLLKNNGITPDETIHCKIEPEKDYFICKLPSNF